MRMRPLRKAANVVAVLAVVLGLVVASAGHASEVKSEVTVTIDEGWIVVDAKNASQFDVLRALAAEAGFAIESSLFDDDYSMITGGRRGSLEEVVNWLLHDQNYILLSGDPQEGSAEPGKLARVILIQRATGAVIDGSRTARDDSRTARETGADTEPQLVEDLDPDSLDGMLVTLAATQNPRANPNDPFEYDAEDGAPGWATPFANLPSRAIAPHGLTMSEALAGTTSIAQQNLQALVEALEQVESQLLIK